MPYNSVNTMHRNEWILLIVLSVLWGGSFFFNEVALTRLPPLTLVLGEAVSLGQLLGMGLVSLALLVVDGRIFKRLRTQTIRERV